MVYQIQVRNRQQPIIQALNIVVESCSFKCNDFRVDQRLKAQCRASSSMRIVMPILKNFIKKIKAIQHGVVMFKCGFMSN